MAAAGEMKLPVADTEFLFGMRSTDPKHIFVKRILESKPDLTIPSFAIFEMVVVLLSEGKSKDVIIETLELINSIIKKYNLKVMDLNIKQLTTGLTIYDRRGLFDSLIAGCALLYDGIVIGDDEHFLGIAGLRRKTLRQYLDEVKK
ncbi:MAG: PIN domain-containing protein [Candidatus Hydrothermarchaeota archaeon]|nr:PIN domain-containing protein [Candidatus Hydrothermarchaeota archaeon]